jgi:hypothetical protein
VFVRRAIHNTTAVPKGYDNENIRNFLHQWRNTYNTKYRQSTFRVGVTSLKSVKVK